MTSIQEYPFSQCKSLEHIYVDANNDVYSSDENGCLFDKQKKVLIRYPCSNKRSEYYIPDGVTKIYSYAFDNCNMSKLHIPSTVKYIQAGNSMDQTSVFIDDLSAWCAIEFSSADSNPISPFGSLYVNNEKVTDLVIPDGV